MLHVLSHDDEARTPDAQNICDGASVSVPRFPLPPGDGSLCDARTSVWAQNLFDLFGTCSDSGLIPGLQRQSRVVCWCSAGVLSRAVRRRERVFDTLTLACAHTAHKKMSSRFGHVMSSKVGSLGCTVKQDSPVECFCFPYQHKVNVILFSLLSSSFSLSLVLSSPLLSSSLLFSPLSLSLFFNLC